MEFSVLKSTGADGERWRVLSERLPPRLRDLHFLPEYVRIYEKSQRIAGYLACLNSDDGYVIQPFVVRPLNGLSFLAARNLPDQYYDIASPYGFGGPVASALSPMAEKGLFKEFDRRFTDYCRTQ